MVVVAAASTAAMVERWWPAVVTIVVVEVTVVMALVTFFSFSHNYSFNIHVITTYPTLSYFLLIPIKLIFIFPVLYLVVITLISV